MQLNHQQVAVLDTALQRNDSIVVEALAGTGKTFILVELLACLRGSTFLCAFGANAVKLLQSRVDGRGLGGDHVKIRTTNSLGMSTWMRANRGRSISVEPNKTRLMLDDIAEVQPLAAKFGPFLCKLIAHGKRAGLGVLSSINKDANWLALVEHFGLEDSLQGETEQLGELIALAQIVYHKSLQACYTTIDYDDQILAPMYFDSRFIKYDNVLLDEAQDTSPLRLNMILRLCKRGGRFIAVGDRNQAIMQFTGAASNSMDEIQSMTDALTLPLSITYRVPKSGVLLAKTWVPAFEAAEDNIEGEIETVPMVPPIAPPIDVTMGGLFGGPADTHRRFVPGLQEKGFMDCAPFTADDAILCRTTRPLVELAYQLLRQQIPCRVEGRDIGDGILRLAQRFRVSSLSEIDTKTREYKRREVARLQAAYQDAKAENVGDQCDTLLVLIGSCMERGGYTLGDLSALVKSIFGDLLEGQQPNCCTLSTVHKAKGREWRRVFVLGLYQYMPSRHAKQPWEVASERNLQYVAVTRHKQSLVIVTMPDGDRNERQNGSTHGVTRQSNRKRERRPA